MANSTTKTGTVAVIGMVVAGHSMLTYALRVCQPRLRQTEGRSSDRKEKVEVWFRQVLSTFR